MCELGCVAGVMSVTALYCPGVRGGNFPGFILETFEERIGGFVAAFLLLFFALYFG